MAWNLGMWPHCRAHSTWTGATQHCYSFWPLEGFLLSWLVVYFHLVLPEALSETKSAPSFQPCILWTCCRACQQCSYLDPHHSPPVYRGAGALQRGHFKYWALHWISTESVAEVMREPVLMGLPVLKSKIPWTIQTYSSNLSQLCTERQDFSLAEHVRTDMGWNGVSEARCILVLSPANMAWRRSLGDFLMLGTQLPWTDFAGHGRYRYNVGCYVLPHTFLLLCTGSDHTHNWTGYTIWNQANVKG